MRFLIDAQLPPRLTTKLIAAGHEAIHVFETPAPEATDLQVVEEANNRGAALLTKDEDFAELSRRGVLSEPLVWLRSGNMTTDSLWTMLEPLLPAIERACQAGERIVEIR